MKKYVFICIIAMDITFCYSQNRNVDSALLSYINLPSSDSLELLLAKTSNDTTRVNRLALLSFNYAFNQADKSVAYGERGVQLSRQLGYKKGIANCSNSLGWGLWGVGNYSHGLRIALNVLHLYEELKDEEKIAFSHYLLANIYRDFGDLKRAMVEVKKGAKIFDALNASDLIGNAITGSIYDLQNQLDSASYHIQKAVDIDKKINQGRWGWLYYLQGNIYRKMKEYDSAMYYYRTALTLVQYKDIVETFNGIAMLYRETGLIDSSVFYATEVMQKWRHISYQRGVQQAADILADNYKKLKQADSTIKYLDLSKALNDSLFNQTNERNIQNMAFNEQLRQNEILRERAEFRSQLKIYALLALGLVFLVIALLLWRNNRHRKKAYALLQQQELETDTQRKKVEQTLLELKSTQSQLIQSEKMASLGELTAGIAHEIQNPLNFVNNFSDVNKEMLDELNEELDKHNYDDAKSLTKDIIANEEKINHHGRRADAIVKGMLQHSRSSSGAKESTDINALVDEYIRLSYHGQRAKDKSVDATITTDFNSKIKRIDIIPQDIGRVLLNILNNAFFAVAEKKKQADENYAPIVSVSTMKENNQFIIKIKDNGVGISAKLLDKIFQPFFTTKPTGEGTGLGLSLAYDIVKAHGGELKVETAEGEGSIFSIQLPVR